MSLYNKAAEVIRQIGHGTVDDVLPHMPHFDREQVRKALENAKWRGLLDSTGNRASREKVCRPGSLPAVYFPPGESLTTEELDDEALWRPIQTGPYYAYPSIFDYGQGRAVKLTWGESTERSTA